jgi:hypothetical protein
MTAGGQAKDIRYDLWHSFLALEPDPRTAISEASMKSQSGTQPAFCFSTDGYIVKGTSVSDKCELVRLLKDWLGASDKQTIGDIGTFGGSPCVFINLENDLEAVLNGDTKRNAVERYVEDAQGRGEDTSWLVISNRRGRLNKLTFREDGFDTPGWYCYLRHPLSERRKV